MDLHLQELRRHLVTNPQDLVSREKLTHHALRAKNGYFVAWRGGQGLPKNTPSVMISQPVFPAENSPFIGQSYSVYALTDTVTDLIQFMPLQPDGIISLPEEKFFPFRDFVDNVKTFLAKFNLGLERPAREAIYQPLYDTALVGVESGNSWGTYISFFQQPLGSREDGSSRYRNQTHTNMDQSGSLPYPKNFIITGISFIPEPSAAFEDVAAFANASWFRLFIGTMEYQVMPSQSSIIFPSKTSPGLALRLNSSMQPAYPMPDFIELIPQQNFRTELVTPNPFPKIKPFEMRSILHGFFIRRP